MTSIPGRPSSTSSTRTLPPPPPAAAQAKAFLDVQMVDDAGAPLAGEPVKIELPDGTMIDDKLDSQGRLRRDDIDPGSAKIHLVDHESIAADAAAAAAPASS